MNMPGRGGRRWWNFGSHFTWAASLFLAGLGAKLGLILSQGFSLPYQDQWPGEAVDMFIPYVAGKFSLTMLCTPHNEHWIVFTRIVDMALLSLNGQWDNFLEMACNAVIQCAGVAAFGWAMASLMGKRSWLLLWPALALDLALPFAWENTLWGYQSQFYFLFIFSWLTIWLLGLNKPWSARWWLGLPMALAALFTVASGFLAAATVMALTALVAFKQRDWRRQVPTWGFCVAIIALGLLLKFSVVNFDADKAHSAGELLRALGKSLAWPWVMLPWYAPFNLFPLLLLGWMCLRSPEPPRPRDLLILGMGIWAGLQGLAGAYARGSGGIGPAWRYMDSLSFISISGALATLVLLTDYRPRFRNGPWLCAALACWTLVCLGGLGWLTHSACTQAIPDAWDEKAVQTKASRAWVATGDPRVFLAQPVDKRISPLAGWLMGQPEIRSILPASVREPLQVTPAQITSNAFVRDGWRLAVADDPTETSWGSYTAQQVAARGTFESQPVKSSALPYLEIAVAGDLGAEGLSLELVELNGGRVTEIRPASPPGGEWVNVQVKAPAGEFKMVARDESDTKWFAFKEPREMGGWSYWNLRFLAVSKWFVVLGVLGFLMNMVGLFGNQGGSVE